MAIIIGADFVPTDSNQMLFEAGSAEELFGDELCSLLQNADYRIFNLEKPLSDRGDPIRKCGPNLSASEQSAVLYEKVGIDLLTLANNHIMDQGVDGLLSTCSALRAGEISFVGAGKDRYEAMKPFFFPMFGKRIGVYACTEHEFSVAENNRAGANPFDPLCSLDHISDAKKNCDYLIVLYHGGKEHYRYPSPNLQKVCHRIVEKGADLVLCQHSHCIGCEEKYLQGTIVYGQGNFLFDSSKNPYWNTGLLVLIHERFVIEYLPIIRQGNGVRIAPREEASAILDGFRKRSEEIKAPLFVEEKYSEFAQEMRDSIYASFSRKESLLFRIVNKLFRNKLRSYRYKKKYTSEKRLEMSNRIACEAWRELSLAALKESE